MPFNNSVLLVSDIDLNEADYSTTLSGCIEQFSDYLESEPALYSPSTVVYYTTHADIALTIIQAFDPDVLPYTVSKSHIQYLVSEIVVRGYSVKYCKHLITGLKKICKFYHNNIFDNTAFRWSVDARPAANWLTESQAAQLLSLDLSPIQELILHLELCMGLRRSEVGRLKVSDIHNGYLDVHGKGSMGGKFRRIPFHHDTQKVLDRFLQYRRWLIDAHFARWGKCDIPEQLLIWSNDSRGLFQYNIESGSGLDGILARISKLVCFDFSHHTLRRTFGRILHRSNVKIQTISKLLGHEDTATTVKYLGLDMDDMIDGMSMMKIKGLDDCNEI